MGEVQSVSSDREFSAYSELQKLSDKELQEEYLKGDNIHISTSKSSAAKRLLDIRNQQKQTSAIENVETVVKQLQLSHKELLNIVSVLMFFKKHWLPKQPMWLRVIIFIFGSIVLAIILNLAADWIAKFIFHW